MTWKLTKAEQKVLSKIQKEANDKFGDKLFTEETNEELLFVIDKLVEADVPEWKKKYYRAVRKDFDKVRIETNDAVAKEMDDFVNKKIKEAIKDGKLPAKKE